LKDYIILSAMVLLGLAMTVFAIFFINNFSKDDKNKKEKGNDD